VRDIDGDEDVGAFFLESDEIEDDGSEVRGWSTRVGVRRWSLGCDEGVGWNPLTLAMLLAFFLFTRRERS